MRFRTRCVHAGQEPDPVYGGVVEPLHLSTTYAQPAPGQAKVHEYSRSTNPTRGTLERCLAGLEGGPGAAAFSSGMAALSCLLHTFPQRHVICGENVYGGTHRAFENVYAPMGYRFSFVDTRDPEKVAAAIEEDTALVVLETPSNPLMHVTDIAAVCEVAHARGVKVAVDNTFMTPHWQRPLEHGADFVVHSGTKYLGGHSDVVIGAVVPAREEDLAKLRYQQKCVGAVPSPFDCWLTLRGIKTLAVRMAASEASARRLAEHLRGLSSVKAVHWAGFEDHPGAAVQAKQAGGAGGAVLAFDVGSLEAAKAVCSKLEVIHLAESLGAVESLICVPALMTHASVPAEHRARLGLHDGLLRLSVGVEDVEDLLEDLQRGLPS